MTLPRRSCHYALRTARRPVRHPDVRRVVDAAGNVDHCRSYRPAHRLGVARGRSVARTQDHLSCRHLVGMVAWPFSQAARGETITPDLVREDRCRGRPVPPPTRNDRRHGHEGQMR